MSERITKTLLKMYASPSVEFEIADTEVRGFSVRFRPEGQPVYFFRYSFGGGRRKKISLGLANEIAPEKARETAREFRAFITQGKDPDIERKKILNNPTVEELANRYMKEHAARNKKIRSIKNDDCLWRLNILPVIGSKLTNSIDVEDILEIKGHLAKKPTTANRALALLSKVMSLAEVWKYRPQNSNPCKFVDRYPENKRDRILNAEELSKLGEALRKHESDCPEVVNLIRILLLTGARLNEIMTAKITQLNIEKSILILPDSKTGAGTLQLSKSALDLINSITRGPSPWLVPGPVKGHPIRYPWTSWRRICASAGIIGLRIHDLRHIFGSYSHHYGASQKAVAQLLRHKQLATTARYMQEVDGDTLEAANKTASKLGELLGPKN